MKKDKSPQKDKISWRLYTGILNRSLFTVSPPSLLSSEAIRMALNLDSN
jgi:hypothetical protein